MVGFAALESFGGWCQDAFTNHNLLPDASHSLMTADGPTRTAVRVSARDRYRPHCRPSMRVTKRSEKKVAESEGASRIGMEHGALASIVVGTHASVFVDRRVAIKPAS